MELLIAAGIPSAIVAFCFWLLEKRIQERAEAEKNERARRQREQDEKERRFRRCSKRDAEDVDWLRIFLWQVRSGWFLW